MPEFSPSSSRPKTHPAGATELRFRCPKAHDGKRDNRYTLTWNRLTGFFHCHWTGCHYSGKVGGAEYVPNVRQDAGPLGTEPVPPELHALFRQRGVDPEYTIRRYRVRYAESRLLWPGDPGYAGRATVPGQQPKQLAMGGFAPSKGSLIGAHLLREGGHVVVVQGDGGSAAVPTPWIGVGIEGANFLDAQAARIVLSRPKSVTLCGDGGEPMLVPDVLERSGIEVRRVAELPLKHGIDDLPMSLRVLLLLGAERIA